MTQCNGMADNGLFGDDGEDDISIECLLLEGHSGKHVGCMLNRQTVTWADSDQGYPPVYDNETGVEIEDPGGVIETTSIQQ